MSTVVERMGQFVAGLKYEDLNEKVIDYAKRILLDAIGCAYGGLESEPARMVRNAVHALSSSGQATIFGKNTKATAPYAALANGCAIRYQDYNDTFFGPGWTGHPSDNLSALLAVAEWHELTGRDFLLAMVAAYEVQTRFSDLPCPKLLWHRGWHHSTICSYAGAAGVAKLLGLDAGQVAHALALSGARSNTFSEIRHGLIPMDKALSATILASQSILYVLLAKQGFTGSSTLIEGPYGFRHALAGGVDVEPLVPKKGDFRILKVGLKPYPVEAMVPAMVDAAVQIKDEFNVVPGEIESIRIFCSEEAMTKPSWDHSNLPPATKEAADHSFYYCVAVALIAGEVTSKQFTDDWLRNPIVATLMAKMGFEAKPEHTAMFKKESVRSASIEITTPRGVFNRGCLYPKGVWQNPMTWDDVKKKFVTQAESILTSTRMQEIMDRSFALEKEPNMRSFIEVLGGSAN